MGHWHCQDCCGTFDSLAITACSGYQRAAIREQGIENRSPKAKSSNPSTSIMLLLAAKIVRNKSLFEMQCTMHSVYCWVSSASLSGRTMESPQVSPAPLLLGFPALPSWLTTTAKGCSFLLTQLLLLQFIKRNAYEYFSWP